MSRFMRGAYRSMEAYTPGEQPRVPGLIKLNTNESPFPPSPGVISAVASADEAEKLRLYSDPSLSSLIDAIAARQGVNPENVTAGNGSDEIIAFAFMAFGEDGAAFPDITYGFYPVWARLFGMEDEIIPLNEDFSIDVPGFIGRRRMVVIANPNAPTGIALPLESIERIVAENPDHVVIIDEAYVEFGAESAAGLTQKYDNLLVVRTFSKSHSLAGARIGYAIAGRELIDDLNKMRYSFHPYNINRLSLLAGAAAMREDDYYAACREKIVSGREYTRTALEGMGFEVLPSSANFLFIRHPALPGRLYNDKLRERNILVRRFDKPRISEFNRVTIGDREQMDKLLAATKDILLAGAR